MGHSTIVKTGESKSATRPAQDARLLQALQPLRTLAAKHNLELSSSSTSVSDRFCLSLSVVIDGDEGINRFPRGNYIVVRNGERWALALEGPTGGYNFICTNEGLLLEVDRESRQGAVLFVDKSFPLFTYECGEGETFSFEYRPNADQPSSQVRFGLDKMILAAIANAISASFDSTKRSFEIEMASKTLRIELAKAGAQYPVASFENSTGRNRIRCAILSCGDIPKRYAGLLSDKYTIIQKIQHRKIPIEVSDEPHLLYDARPQIDAVEATQKALGEVVFSDGGNAGSSTRP
jgi:hypothetical protein